MCLSTSDAGIYILKLKTGKAGCQLVNRVHRLYRVLIKNTRYWPDNVQCRLLPTSFNWHCLQSVQRILFGDLRKSWCNSNRNDSSSCYYLNTQNHHLVYLSYDHHFNSNCTRIGFLLKHGLLDNKFEL